MPKPGISAQDPEHRQIAAETLLALRLSRLTRINDDLYIDSRLITQAEYQLFLNEKRAEEAYHQPDHWEVFSLH